MRDLFLKDMGWKLLSLFLAMIIWLTVHQILSESPLPGTGSQKSITITYSNQPVLAVSTGADVHGYRIEPPVVRLVLIGPANLMGELDAGQVRTMVDLSDVGTNAASYLPVQVSPPRGVTLLNVDPDNVTVLPPEKP
jgi:hypothetical protein